MISGRIEPATLLKKYLAQVFSCEFCKIFKNTSLTEYLQTTASEDQNFPHSEVIQSIRRLISIRLKHYPPHTKPYMGQGRGRKKMRCSLLLYCFLFLIRFGDMENVK